MFKRFLIEKENFKRLKSAIFKYNAKLKETGESIESYNKKALIFLSKKILLKKKKDIINLKKEESSISLSLNLEIDNLKQLDYYYEEIRAERSSLLFTIFKYTKTIKLAEKLIKNHCELRNDMVSRINLKALDY